MTIFNKPYYRDTEKELYDKILREKQDKRLEEIEKQLIDKKANVSEETNTSKQQILILHYLGILAFMNLEITKKAKLLSAVLNRGDENIKKAISHINTLQPHKHRSKSVQNLNKILPYFEDLGLTEIANRIKKDIDEVKRVENKIVKT